MKKYSTGRAALAALFICSAAMSLVGCSPKQKELQSFDVQYLDYFDTFTSVTIYAEDQEQFSGYAQIVKENLEHYHQLFDIYHNYDGMNNVKSINDEAGVMPVEVEPEVLDMLEYAKEEYEATDGLVNVAMGSVLSIWHDYREQGMADPEKAAVPNTAELQDAAKHMDISKVELDPAASTVYLADPDMQLDVGAIAKGYATQLISDKLREAGVTSALLSVGGNVETIGKRGDGKDWKVGIQNPDTSSTKAYLHAIKLDDYALVTSGTYQRFYEVDGVRYHHIVNPDTLMPWQEYASVTILTKDSGRADALSTGVFNMELEKGQAFIESLEDTEALWVMPDGSEVESSGFGAFIAD